MLAKALKNAFFNSSTWIIVLLLNLLATPYLVHKLTPEGFGLLMIINGILGYMTILDFSFRDALIKFLSDYYARKKYNEACSSFNTVVCFQLLLGIAGSIILYFARDVVLGWFNISTTYLEEANKSYIFMCLGFPVSLINGIFSSFPVAMQRFDVSAMLTTIAGVATIVGSIIVVMFGCGLSTVILWNVVVLLLSCILHQFWIKRTYVWYRFSPVIEKRVLKQMFGFGVFSQLAKSASMVNDQLLRIVIGSILGATAVTYFTVPLRLINGLQGLIDKISKVMFPLTSELAALNDMESLKKGYLWSAKYITILITPIYVAMAIYAKDILELWMGKAFSENSWMVMTLSAVTYLLVSWTMVPSNIAFGLGKAKINALFASIVAICNIIIIYPLCYYYGIIGAAAAVLLTQIQTPFFIIIVSKHFGKGFGMKVLIEAYLVPSFFGIIVAIIGSVAGTALVTSLNRIIIGVPIVILTYYMVIVVFRIIPLDEIKLIKKTLFGKKLLQ